MIIERIKVFMFLLKGGGKTMQALIDSYVALIVAGRRNITQVPVNLRDTVLADLNAIGLDGYGNPLPVTP